MKQHYCNIGELSGDEAKTNNIKQLVHDIVSFQNSKMNQYLFSTKKPETVKGIVDGRKGYLHRYNFCPYCGNKVNWKQIIKQVIS